MTETLRIVFFLVLLPIGLVAITRLATWPLYRRVCLIALGMWLAGLGAMTLVEQSCAGGNLIYGYSDCGALPRWVRLQLPAYGLFAMLGAMAIFALMTVALIVRTLLRHRKDA